MSPPPYISPDDLSPLSAGKTGIRRPVTRGEDEPAGMDMDTGLLGDFHYFCSGVVKFHSETVWLFVVNWSFYAWKGFLSLSGEPFFLWLSDFPPLGNFAHRIMV